MNNLNPYPRPLAEHWVCSCFCTNNLYFLIIIFPKPIRGDALPAGGWRGRPRPPPPTPAEKWLLPAGRVPKDVHTINIIRLTRDRRVKDAGEDAVMRFELEVRGCGASGGWGCCRWCRIAMHSSRFTIYENEICYCHFDELYFEQLAVLSSQLQRTTPRALDVSPTRSPSPPCQFVPQPSLIWPTAASCFILQLIIMPINQRYNAYRPQPQTGKIKRRPTTMMKSCLKCLLLCGGTSSTRMVRELHWHYDYKYDYDNGCGYLPINNDGVRRRLVAVTTALLITAAAAGKLKIKRESIG